MSEKYLKQVELIPGKLRVVMVEVSKKERKEKERKERERKAR